MQLADGIGLTAPPPAGAAGQAQTVGTPGIRQYWYWVVTHFPIGAVIGGPYFIRNAPDALSASNYVLVVWDALAGAESYDVLRTNGNRFPSAAGDYALAIGLTAASVRDQGQALQAYDPRGLPYGSPVSCRITLNNRNYERPTIELPCQVRVSTILFADGTEQTTAAGEIELPDLIAGDGITLTTDPGPPETITIDSDVYHWQRDVDAGGHALTNLGDPGGIVGSGSLTLSAAVNIKLNPGPGNGVVLAGATGGGMAVLEGLILGYAKTFIFNEFAVKAPVGEANFFSVGVDGLMHYNSIPTYASRQDAQNAIGAPGVVCSDNDGYLFVT